MKKIIIALAMVMGLISTAHVAKAGLLDYEPFNYATGPVVTTSSASVPPWATHSGTAAQIQVTNTASDATASLSVPNFFTPSANRIIISQASSEDIHRNFDAAPALHPGTLYASFLVKFTTAPTCTVAAPVYFAHFINGTSIFSGRCWVGTDAAGTFKLGVSSSSTAPATTEFSTAVSATATHLVVTYFNTTTGDSSLWVDPSSNTYGLTTAPTADSVESTLVPSTTGSNEPQGFAFRQGSATQGICDVDELRCGTTWADVTSTLSRSKATVDFVDVNATGTLPATQTVALSAITSTAVIVTAGAATGAAEITASAPGTISGNSSSNLTFSFSPPVGINDGAIYTKTFNYTTNGIPAAFSIVVNARVHKVVNSTKHWEVFE